MFAVNVKSVKAAADAVLELLWLRMAVVQIQHRAGDVGGVGYYGSVGAGWYGGVGCESSKCGGCDVAGGGVIAALGW